MRICADGGANRLYDEIPKLLSCASDEAAVRVRKQHLPQSIRGDLDSIREDVRTFYVDNGVEITDLAADQDSTDLEKCLRAVEENAMWEDWDLNIHNILAVGTVSLS